MFRPTGTGWPCASRRSISSRQQAEDELLRLLELRVLLLQRDLVLHPLRVDLVHLGDHVDPGDIVHALDRAGRLQRRTWSHERSSAGGYTDRSPAGNDGRGSMPACAGMDGRSASLVSGLAWAGSGAARRTAREDEKLLTMSVHRADHARIERSHDVLHRHRRILALAHRRAFEPPARRVCRRRRAASQRSVIGITRASSTRRASTRVATFAPLRAIRSRISGWPLASCRAIAPVSTTSPARRGALFQV
jgi:hypothetical protein